MADPFLPDPYIEVAWGFGPYDSPTGGDWVDITDYVDEVHTSRGRSNEFDTFPPGQMKVVLDNTDRRFDPLNSTGPHFGDLVANVPIRLRADISGTKYDIWYGFVDSWPTSYDEGGFITELTISCSDIFKIFAERSAPDTMVEDIEAMVGTPPLPIGIIRRWYRFDQVRPGEQVIPDVYGTGGTDLTVYGKWDGQERCARASSSDRALGLAEHTGPEDMLNNYRGAENIIGPFDNSPIKSDHWSIAFTFRVTEQGSMQGYSLPLVWIGHHVPSSPPQFTDIYVLSLHQGGSHHPSAGTCPGCFTANCDTAGVSMTVNTGPGGFNDLTGSNFLTGGTWNPFDGKAHSVVVFRHATTLEVWGDGVLVGTVTLGGATGLEAWDTANSLRVYWPFQGQPLSLGRRFPGVIIQELIFMDAVNLSTFSAPDLHDSLMIGMAETVPSGDAAAHLMNRIGWNPLKQVIDACEVLVTAPANPYGHTVMELLQNYADSEDGRVFVDRSGKVAFHSTARFQTQTVENTVQYTFDDTNASSVSIDGEFRVTMDDEFVYEAAEVSRDEGIMQHAASTSTPARTYSLTGLRLQSDHQAKGRAEKIVFRYATPSIRTQSYDVWPEADPSDWATLLQLDIGHRVRLILTPRQKGSQIDIQQHLELIEHHITPTDWVMTMNGSPVDNTVYFTWGGTGAQGWDNGVWR